MKHFSNVAENSIERMFCCSKLSTIFVQHCERILLTTINTVHSKTLFSPVILQTPFLTVYHVFDCVNHKPPKHMCRKTIAPMAVKVSLFQNVIWFFINRTQFGGTQLTSVFPQSCFLDGLLNLTHSKFNVRSLFLNT